jgi:hypothetical protein
MLANIAEEHDYKWAFKRSIEKFHVVPAYRCMIGTHVFPKAITWTWKSCRRIKHKVFLWYPMHDRLNTRELHKRKMVFNPD